MTLTRPDKAHSCRTYGRPLQFPRKDFFLESREHEAPMLCFTEVPHLTKGLLHGGTPATGRSSVKHPRGSDKGDSGTVTMRWIQIINSRRCNRGYYIAKDADLIVDNTQTGSSSLRKAGLKVVDTIMEGQAQACMLITSMHQWKTGESQDDIQAALRGDQSPEVLLMLEVQHSPNHGAGDVAEFLVSKGYCSDERNSCKWQWILTESTSS